MLTDVHEPTQADGMDQTAISEALDPPAESESAPSADEIFSSLPEEDGYTTAGDTGDSACENEEAADCLRRRIDRR